MFVLNNILCDTRGCSVTLINEYVFEIGKVAECSSKEKQQYQAWSYCCCCCCSCCLHCWRRRAQVCCAATLRCAPGYLHGGRARGCAAFWSSQGSCPGTLCPTAPTPWPWATTSSLGWKMLHFSGFNLLERCWWSLLQLRVWASDRDHVDISDLDFC